MLSRNVSDGSEQRTYMAFIVVFNQVSNVVSRLNLLNTFHQHHIFSENLSNTLLAFLHVQTFNNLCPLSRPITFIPSRCLAIIPQMTSFCHPSASITRHIDQLQLFCLSCLLPQLLQRFLVLEKQLIASVAKVLMVHCVNLGLELC